MTQINQYTVTLTGVQLTMLHRFLRAYADRMSVEGYNRRKYGLTPLANYAEQYEMARELMCVLAKAEPFYGHQWQTDTALLKEGQTILAAINDEMKYGTIIKDSWDKQLVLYVEYDGGFGGEGWSLNSIKAWMPIPTYNKQETLQL